MKKSATKHPSPPPGLSPEARIWWATLQDEYQVHDAGGLAVLAAAAEAFDRARQARLLIEAEGMTTVDRFGQARAHPAVAVERDARDQMLKALSSTKSRPRAVEIGRRPPAGVAIDAHKKDA